MSAVARIPVRLRRSSLEILLAYQMDKANLVHVSEYRFDPIRRWRLDFAFVPEKLAVEVEGGTWIQGGGRHNRGAGMEKDIEKANALTIAGWRLLRFTGKTIRSGEALRTIEQALLLLARP